jgi:hypothetical protein
LIYDVIITNKSSRVIRTALREQVLLELELAAHLLVAQRTLGLQLPTAFLIVCFLVFELDNLEAVLAVLELMLVSALLDVMLEKLGDFNVLRAELAVSDVFTFLGQVQVQQVLVLKLYTANSTELTAAASFVFLLRLLDLSQLIVDVLLHRHEYH